MEIDIRVDHGTGREKHTISGDRILIGRNPDCTLVVNENSVSRQHAELVKEDGKVLLKDLGSANGTFLNEQKVVESVEVKRGDRVRVGTRLILIEKIVSEHIT